MQFRKRLFFFRVSLLLGSAPLLLSVASHAQPTDSSAQLTRDWVPVEQLSDEQLLLLPPACCGMFVEPPRQGEYAEQSPEISPTQIDAEAGFSQQQEGQLLIQGPVSIRQGYRSIEASDSAELDQDEETVSLRGSVMFREPGILLTGESAFIDQASNRSQLDQAGYVFYDSNIHGTAGRLTYDGDAGRITVDNGEFTRCEPGNEFWVLRARSLRLEPEAGRGRATAVSLRIRDVPVFYYPYTVPFPIGDERMSGFLAPAISNSRNGGLDIAAPYYFNLAPHYDATLTPRIIADRGPMLSGEFRYLASWSMNTLNGSLLPDDSLYDAATAAIPGSDSPPVQNRWFFGYEHQGALSDNWSTFVDYNAVSDQDYFRDLGSRGLNLENRTHLNRQGLLNYQSRHVQGQANVQRIELIDPFISASDINKPYDRLPQLRLNASNSAGGLQYGAESSYTVFDRDLDRRRLSPQHMENGALVTGRRLTVEPSVSYPLRTPGTFLVPTLSYRYARWELENQAAGTDARPERGVGVFSLDSGLIFERAVQYTGRSYVQTLEPRLFYLYSEYEEQQQLPVFDTAQRHFNFNQLFREDRFSGADRVGDANQLSAAVSTRFFDMQGAERARFSLGQIFYFENRHVSLDSPLQNWLTLQPLDTSRSPLLAEAIYAFADRWQFRTDLQWNDHSGRIEEGSVALRLQSDQDHLLNLSYRYVEKAEVILDLPAELDPRIRQTDVSGIWRLNNNWRFLGRWNYDHSNSRNLETFAGLEYSNCCATMRLIVRDWANDYQFLHAESRQNRGVFFQFSLHGLGNVTGGGISSLLSNSIPGFKEHLN